MRGVYSYRPLLFWVDSSEIGLFLRGERGKPPVLG